MDTKEEVGFVISSRDFLIYLDGLPTIHVNDLVETAEGTRGWVNALEKDRVEVLMLDEAKITPGLMFRRLKGSLAVTPGHFLLGRAINPLGIPIDGKGLLAKTGTGPALELERQAPGIEYRQFINTQFMTGITMIDTLIPIGKGQRELIMGDAHSGKTAFLIDVITNQKNTNTIVVYASIGKPSVTTKTLIDILRANKALTYTIIVATSSTDPAPMIFLTPKTAFTIAEYFQKMGRDVLLILDDLGYHAKIYREIALLGNKSPGRESYPGDIFYQHAHLVERAGNFKPEYGGGSITALPVIELNLSDFTTFIPTNLMAMTDGHLLFKSALHNQGQNPAIDISLSVSRVGRQTQDRISNLISSRVRLLLSQAEELETISRFSSELPFQTQLILRQKELIEEVMKHEPFTFIPKEIQVILLGLTFTSFMHDKNAAFVEKNRNILLEGFSKHPKLQVVTKSVFNFKTDEELIRQLEACAPILKQICQT